jgi:predicted DNA-binding transcriptional regulator YafY
VPIDGEAGIGYVLRRGFDLPPLMLDTEEAEAVAVGAQLLHRTGDAALQAATRRVLAKLSAVLPPEARERLELGTVFVSRAGTPAVRNVDLRLVRLAIHQRRKLRLRYRDAAGRQSDRTIRPVAVAYYVMATIIAGWCETRRDFRHFRVDRIASVELLEETWDDQDGTLAAAWRALPRFPAEANA